MNYGHLDYQAWCNETDERQNLEKEKEEERYGKWVDDRIKGLSTIKNYSHNDQWGFLEV